MLLKLPKTWSKLKVCVIHYSSSDVCHSAMNLRFYFYFFKNFFTYFNFSYFYTAKLLPFSTAICSSQLSWVWAPGSESTP